MSRGRPTPALKMTNRQRKLLNEYSQKTTIPSNELLRIRLLILASEGKNNMEISRLLNVSVNTIKKWRSRWSASYEKFLVFESGVNNKGVSDKELLKKLLIVLQDLPRSGTPKQITLSQENQIIAISCKKPKDYGIIMNKWTHEQIANTAIAQGVIDSISTRTVGYILKKNKLRPFKNDYWLFPKIANWEAFVSRVSLVSGLILEATQGIRPNVHLISVDEKSGIQALERLKGTAPKSKGFGGLVEHEYTRHGTTCLIGATNVANGNLINALLNETRTEEDFLGFTVQTVSKLPAQDEIIFLADQLNIHKSESLVIYFAQLNGFEGDLGVKGKKGILKNMETRQAFLENSEHRVRFVFTPKHCSWLNPIENWFAKLQRHIITGGSFCSIKELEDEIRAYIEFYNRCLVKPLNWKFKGFYKAKKLKNINYQGLRA